MLVLIMAVVLAATWIVFVTEMLRKRRQIREINSTNWALLELASARELEICALRKQLAERENPLQPDTKIQCAPAQGIN
jgi:hypothetical protein